MASRLQAEIKQTRPFGSLRQEVILQIARTSAILTHALDQALRGHGITHTQYNVLRILRGAGCSGLCRHEVASRLVTMVPDVSRLLDRMVRVGLITRIRDAADRRMVKARITPHGLAILALLDAPSLALADESLAHVSDDDLSILIRLLEQLRSPSPAPHEATPEE